MRLFALLVLTASCMPTFPPVPPDEERGDASEATPDGVDGGSTLPPGVDAPPGDPSRPAREYFEANVKPIMQSACSACHAGANGPEFLVGDDMRLALLAWPNLVVPGDASASRLFVYGRSEQHSGTELTNDQGESVRAWIELEPRPEDTDPDPVTPHFTPVAGANEIDLTPVGGYLEGAKLRFTMQTLSGGGLYLTSLRLASGTGAEGVHVKHPLFVMHCPDPVVDPVDSFYGHEVDVETGMEAPIGGGTIALMEWASTCDLTLHFEEVGPSTGPEPPDPAGCIDVPTFTSQARPQLSNRCGNCHDGGNGTATASFDLTKIDDLSAAGQLEACVQTRGKVNLANEAMSILFQRVEPDQDTDHPVTLNDANFTAFQNAVLAWAVNEM